MVRYVNINLLATGASGTFVLSLNNSSALEGDRISGGGVANKVQTLLHGDHVHVGEVVQVVEEPGKERLIIW